MANHGSGPIAELGCKCFFAFGLGLECQLFWRPSTFGRGYAVCSPWPPAASAERGTGPLPEHRSQVLIVTLPLCACSLESLANLLCVLRHGHSWPPRLLPAGTWGVPAWDSGQAWPVLNEVLALPGWPLGAGGGGDAQGAPWCIRT